MLYSGALNTKLRVLPKVKVIFVLAIAIFHGVVDILLIFDTGSLTNQQNKKYTYTISMEFEPVTSFLIDKSPDHFSGESRHIFHIGFSFNYKMTPKFRIRNVCGTF